ncbi:MAG: hypothetical protein CBD77_02125 [bacterium TMED217]|nr:MAG: hypothetical protein CBD77_02125 [bacterium TMED217]|tara:strand:- start:27335 stop:28294 length:960 start_codon:yes stop_codon:yes gene_type:complete
MIENINLETLKKSIYRQKNLFVSIFIGWFIIFGLYYSFVERSYTSSMEIIPSESNQSSSSLLGSFGVNLPIGSSVNYNSSVLYPDIVTSNRLIKKLMHSNIIFESQERQIKDIFLEKYFNKAKKKGVSEYELDLLIIDFFKSNIISVSRNRMTEITTVDIRTFDKSLSLILALELFDIFNYLQLEKRNENLDSQMNYTKLRVDKVSNNLDALQKKKIAFIKSNVDIRSPQLTYELDKIVTEINIEKSIFLSLRDKYEVFEIEKNNLSNIASFIDDPIEPIKHSSPSFRLSFLISLLFLFSIYAILCLRDINFTLPKDYS